MAYRALRRACWDLCFLDELSFEELSDLESFEQSFFPWPWSHANWLEAAKRKEEFLILRLQSSDKNAVLQGVCLVEKGRLEDFASLHKIVVSDELSSQGMALQGMRLLKEHLFSIGVKDLLLEVSITNERALNFYKEFGLEVLCLKKHFYSDGTDAYAMRLKIAQ